MAVWIVLVVIAANGIARADRHAGMLEVALAALVALCWLLVRRHVRRAEMPEWVWYVEQEERRAA